MIRKIFMIVILALVFMYITWNFYSKALRYNPLAEISVANPGSKGSDKRISSKYKPAWSKIIYEKDLFSQRRSYMKEQKPVPADITPGKVEAVWPDVVLRGIVYDLSGDYVAYIEINRSRPVAMRKGDKIEDIEIVDISARKVVLKWNEQTVKLNMGKVRTIKKPRSIK